MKLHEARALAADLRDHLAPYCDRIEIAGSIRRLKPEPKDIELVCIPKLGGGMFGEDRLEAFGICAASLMHITMGDLIHGKHIRGTLRNGIKVDLFTATAHNWGWIFTLRTGSAEHNIKLVQRMKRNGYRCADGRVWWKGEPLDVRTEEAAFSLAGLRYVEPQFRTVEHAKSAAA